MKLLNTVKVKCECCLRKYKLMFFPTKACTCGKTEWIVIN